MRTSNDLGNRENRLETDDGRILTLFTTLTAASLSHVGLGPRSLLRFEEAAPDECNAYGFLGRLLRANDRTPPCFGYSVRDSDNRRCLRAPLVSGTAAGMMFAVAAGKTARQGRPGTAA